MKRIALCVAFLGVSSLAQAQTALIAGAGTVSCAAFTGQYEKDASVEEPYFTWAVGYMSGFNVMANYDHKATKDLAGASLADQKFAVRAYCVDHSTEKYLTAVITLWSSLPEIPYPDNN